MNEFSEFRVLITGGANGFGLACAAELAKAGARVAIGDVDESQLKRAADQLGPGVLPIQLDVSSKASVERAFQTAGQKFEGLDGLVNSAGIIRVTPLEETSESDWDRVLAVNLKGAFLCSQAAAGYLKKSAGGRIVNIASDAAKIGFPMICHYTASKAGLVGLTKAVAAELCGFGITVNAVCPVGAPDTGMGQYLMKWKTGTSGKSEQQVRAAAASGNPIARNCEPADVVNAVMFFLSPRSSFLTGQALDVDGGLVNVHGIPGVSQAGKEN